MKERKIFLLTLIGAMVFTTGCAQKVNKAEVNRQIEAIWNKGDIGLADGLYDPGFVRHIAGKKDVSGLENFKQYIREVRTIYPDFKVNIEDMVIEGDKGAARYTWSGTYKGSLKLPDGTEIPATGKHVTTAGLSFVRFKEGKFVEEFLVEDTLSTAQQLGQVPGPKK